SGDLLEAMLRHETAHAALLIDMLDVLSGSSVSAKDRSVAPPEQELTPTELRVLRFLPTNMSRTEIARELYLSVNTVNTHVRQHLRESRRAGSLDKTLDLYALRISKHLGPTALSAFPL